VWQQPQIYTMLMDYKGRVTVKIDGMAASAGFCYCYGRRKGAHEPGVYDDDSQSGYGSFWR